MAANRLIRRSTAARPAWASRTWATIRDIKESLTGPQASISSVPSPLTVPAYTGSPGPRSTGTDSPVIVFWSTLERPLTTLPSIGIVSPARTRTRSPARTWPAGIRSNGSIGPDPFSGLGRDLQKVADRPAGTLQAQRLERLGEAEQEGHGRRLVPLPQPECPQDRQSHEHVDIEPEASSGFERRGEQARLPRSRPPARSSPGPASGHCLFPGPASGPARPRPGRFPVPARNSRSKPSAHAATTRTSKRDSPFRAGPPGRPASQPAPGPGEATPRDRSRWSRNPRSSNRESGRSPASSRPANLPARREGSQLHWGNQAHAHSACTEIGSSSLPCPSLTLVIESAVWRDLNVLRENSAGWATICAISNSENYRANRELREHDQLRFRVDARMCALRFWRGFPGIECSTRRLVWDADIESDERIKVVRPSGTWGRGRAQIGRETRRWNRIRRTWFAMD